MFEHDVHQLLFGGRILFNGDQPLLVEMKRTEPFSPRFAAVLGKRGGFRSPRDCGCRSFTSTMMATPPGP